MHKYNNAGTSEQLLIHAIYEDKVESIFRARGTKEYDLLAEMKKTLNDPRINDLKWEKVYNWIRLMIRLQDNIDGHFQQIPKFDMMKHIINDGSGISYKVESSISASVFIEIKFKGEK